jgi:hypothetical protein
MNQVTFSPAIPLSEIMEPENQARLQAGLDALAESGTATIIGTLPTEVCSTCGARKTWIHNERYECLQERIGGHKLI